MSTQIWCADCGKRKEPGTRKVLESSTEEGFYQPAEFERVVKGKANKPDAKERVAYLNGAPLPMPQDFYICDNCNGEIRPGEEAMAWTIWNDRMEEPAAWESEYLDLQGKN